MEHNYHHREFLRFHFGDRPHDSLPILLLLNEFSGHWPPDVKALALSLAIDLYKDPGGLTWKCQSADVGWMKSEKIGHDTCGWRACVYCSRLIKGDRRVSA